MSYVFSTATKSPRRKVSSEVLKSAFGLAGLLVFLFLSSCSSSPKSRIPVDLKPITNPTVSVQKLWSQDLDELKYPRKNNLLAQNDAFLFAAVNEKTYKIDKQNGNIIQEASHDFDAVFGVLSDENQLYFLGSRGEIKALDSNTLAPLWQVNMNSVPSAPLSQDRIAIYARFKNGKTFKVDKKTGSTVWEYTIPKKNKYSIDYQNPALLAATKLYLTTDEGQILQFNQRELFQSLTSTPSSVRLAYAVGNSLLGELINAKLMVDEAERFIYASVYGKGIYKIDLNANQISFRNQISSLYPPASLNNQIFAIDAKSSLVAMNPETGEKLWQMDDFNYRLSAPMTRYSKYLILFDLEGYLHVIEPEADALPRVVARFRNQKEMIQTEGLVNSSETQNSASLFYLDDDGELTAVKIRGN